MNPVPRDIRTFLTHNRLASVCFVNDFNELHCFPCLFACVVDRAVLVFKSSRGSRHEKATQTETKVAGTILPEKFDLARMKGIQFEGETIHQHQLSQEFVSEYYRQFPFAHTKTGYVWAIQLKEIKFTNNTLGFGHKTTWSFN